MNYLIEVKSCTLVKHGLALFPDAPTVRGARHVKDLVKALNEGFKTMIIFIIQRDDAESFAPNEKTDKNFSSQLIIAKEAGVLIKALASKVYIDENDLFIEPNKEVDLKF